jgi:O-antigen/teichoic acid export membrane protein
VKVRGLGANSGLALLGDGASKVAALLVVVISARFLSVEEFAALATGLAVAGVLTAVLDLGTGTLLSRDGAASRSERGALFSGSLRDRLPLACAVLLLAPVIGWLLGRPLEAASAAVLALSGALSLTVVGLFRSYQDIRPEALQKLASGTLAVVTATAVCVVAPRADLVLLTLAVVMLVSLFPLIRLAPTVADLGTGLARFAAVRRAAPIGLLALATIAYYRSGTIALAALSNAQATAVYGVASGIAFGLLIIPNAITTALLPRLSSARRPEELVECTRRVLAWTSLIAVCLAAACAAVAPLILPIALGSEYVSASAPFAVLCLGIPLIAASGVIGTALLALGRLRTLGTQVVVSLAVNLIVLALLVPVAGAVGAALATVACEAVGLAVLAHAARPALPGLLRPPSRERRTSLDAAETALP